MFLYKQLAGKHRKLGTTAKSGKRFYGQTVRLDDKVVTLPAQYKKDGTIMRPEMLHTVPVYKHIIHEKPAP